VIAHLQLELKESNTLLRASSAPPQSATDCGATGMAVRRRRVSAQNRQSTRIVRHSDLSTQRRLTAQGRFAPRKGNDALRFLSFGRLPLIRYMTRGEQPQSLTECDQSLQSCIWVWTGSVLSQSIMRPQSNVDRFFSLCHHQVQPTCTVGSRTNLPKLRST
jgi:hypothetical protein